MPQACCCSCARVLQATAYHLACETVKMLSTSSQQKAHSTSLTRRRDSVGVRLLGEWAIFQCSPKKLQYAVSTLTTHPKRFFKRTMNTDPSHEPRRALVRVATTVRLAHSTASRPSMHKYSRKVCDPVTTGPYVSR